MGRGIKRIGDAIDQIGEAGANEVDLVLPYRAFLAGEISLQNRQLHARKLCGASLKLKVILETEYCKTRLLLRMPVRRRWGQIFLRPQRA